MLPDALDAADLALDHAQVKLVLLIVQVVVDPAQVVKVVLHRVWTIVPQVVRVNAPVVRIPVTEVVDLVVPDAIQLARMTATVVVAHAKIPVANLVSPNVRLLATRHV